MKAPGFWAHGQNSLWASLLSPLGLIYNRLTSSRANKTARYKSCLPVICIGNLTMGGAGKTPTALSIAQMLIAEGKKPIFLSRGYGGRETGPVMVTTQNAKDVGDEPLLLKQVAPVCISQDRIAGAKLCEQQDCDVIIMDDGFQNPYLHKNLSLLVIDGGFGHGNEKVFPAGPLRESLENGLKRANGLVLIGPDTTNCRNSIDRISPGLPVLNADITPSCSQNISGETFVAFAGIARPEKFFQTVSSLGGNLVETFSFADHHTFSEQDISRLTQAAKNHQARLITTEKDLVRLPTSMQQKADVIKITLAWQHPDMLKAVLSPVLA